MDPRAAAFVRELAGARPAGSRLPAVKALALQAGVSHRQMLKAVQDAVRDGLLVSRRGAGTVVAGGGAPDRPLRRTSGSEKLLKWEQMALDLGRKAQERAGLGLRVMLLPKSVCVEYGVSFPTARKALRALVREGVLRVQGRGYVSAAERFDPGVGVVAVLAGRQEFHTVGTRGHVQSYVDELERLCSRDALPLRYADLVWRGERLTRLSRVVDEAQGLQRRGVSPVVFVFSNSIPAQFLALLLAMMRKAGLRGALLDLGAARNPPEVPRGRFCLARPGADGNPGRVVADYCRSRGYHRVVFMGEEPTPNWQHARFSSMSRRLSAIDADAVTRFRTVPMPQAQSGSRTLMPEQLSRSYNTRIDSELQIRRAWAQDERRLRQALAPVLLESLEHDKPDVVVGANDRMGIACLDILMSHRLKPPTGGAVIGFDDIPESEAAGLTTYDFNQPALVRELLRATAALPDRDQPVQHVSVSGFVVNRRTA